MAWRLIYRGVGVALLACVALAATSACDPLSTSSRPPDGRDLPEDIPPGSQSSDSEGANAVTPAANLHRDRDPERELKQMKRSRLQSRRAAELLRSGRLTEAIEKARAALRTHELNVDAMLIVSEVFFRQQKYDLALSVATSALRVDARVMTASQRSRAFELQGFAHFALEREPLALEAFRRAVETDANNASAWNNLGIAYFRQGDFSGAEHCFREAVGLDAESIESASNHAAALRSLGQLDRALAVYTELTQRKSPAPELFFNLGLLYLDAPALAGLDDLARLRRAIESFERYLALTRAQRDFSQDLGNELVSPQQAKLYIETAQKLITREERRRTRRQSSQQG